MAVTNTVVSTQYVLDEILFKFMLQVKLLKTSYRDFEPEFRNLQFATGDTIKYRLDENYKAEAGWSATAQPIKQKVRELKINQPFHVMVNYDGNNLTLDRLRSNPYRETHTEAMAAALAVAPESALANAMAAKSYYTIGTPGSAINSPSIINLARTRMNQLGINDNGKRFVALPGDASYTLTTGVQNFFNTKINTAALFDGYLGALSGLQIFETEFLPYHTSGIGAGGGTVNGMIAAGQVAALTASGSTISIKGLQASAQKVFRAGDIIQIAGSYFVHPKSKIKTSQPAQFNVLADVDADGSGNATVSVSPTIDASNTSVDQNIDVPLQLNAAVSLFGSHNMAFAYDRKALVYAMPRIFPLEGGVITKETHSKEYDMAFRWTSFADGKEFVQYDRLDGLFGLQINPELLIRIVF